MLSGNDAKDAQRKQPCIHTASEQICHAHEATFDLVSFRRELATTLARLAVDKNVAAAVQYIRLQQVPEESQADQFCDILSRIVEERRGAVRRCELAFAAGLMAAEDSPFDRHTCFEGIRMFFQDVYQDLRAEVPRLPQIIKSEFMPIMSIMFSADDLKPLLPEEFNQSA
jgi:hypothetical protein